MKDIIVNDMTCMKCVNKINMKLNLNNVKSEIDLKSHRATNIRHSHIEEMDLILCATNSHKMSVLQLYPNLENKVFTLKEYVGIKDELNGIDIKDPWGYDLKTYQECAKEIKECLEKLIEKI